MGIGSVQIAEFTSSFCRSSMISLTRDARAASLTDWGGRCRPTVVGTGGFPETVITSDGADAAVLALSGALGDAASLAVADLSAVTCTSAERLIAAAADVRGLATAVAESSVWPAASPKS